MFLSYSGTANPYHTYAKVNPCIMFPICCMIRQRDFLSTFKVYCDPGFSKNTAFKYETLTSFFYMT